MHKVLATLGIALVLGATPAMAKSFSNYDADGNGNISKDEFYGSVADVGTYSDWDTDNDGLISDTEFDELGYDWDYDAWDADADGYLDSDEFYEGYYTAYDADEDGHWNDGEWDDAGERGLFDW